MNKLLQLTEEEYRKRKELNYSLAKIIIRKSARHAVEEQSLPFKKQINFGSIEHATLLGKGQKAVLIQADNYRTKQAQMDRDNAISNGLIPLLPHEYEEVIACATEITRQLEEKEISLEGLTEQSMIWEDDGVACKGRMDLFQPAPIHEITEMKFTEWPLTESSLRKLIRQQGYDIQAATYTSGIHIITGELPAFKWIFCEMKPPYQIRRVNLTDTMRLVGMQKWDRARNTWKTCLESGVWSGYGDDLDLEPDWWELKEMPQYSVPEALGEDYSDPEGDTWF